MTPNNEKASARNANAIIADESTRRQFFFAKMIIFTTIQAMKNLLFLVSLFALTASSAQKPFAKIEKGRFAIERDTTEFKKFLKDNLFAESKKLISLDKVEIKKQAMLTLEDEYYFVLVTDFKNHIRIAKWLNKVATIYIRKKSSMARICSKTSIKPAQAVKIASRMSLFLTEKEIGPAAKP